MDLLVVAYRTFLRPGRALSIVIETNERSTP
jgi:hypothetical protein